MAQSPSSVVALLAVLALHSLAVTAQDNSTRFSFEELTVVGTNLPGARRQHRVEYDQVDNRIILFGGGTADAETYAYDLNTNTWAVINVGATKPPARFSFLSGMQQDGGNNRFIIATGEGAGDAFFNDIWALDLVAGTNNGAWTELPKVGAVPDIRYGCSGGIWFGDPRYFMVTHGFKGSERFDDSFAYDLQNERWIQIDGSGQPSARCLQAGTVVENHELVLYGGCGSGGFGPCPGNDAQRRTFGAGSTTPDNSGGWQRQAAGCERPSVRGGMHIAPGNPAGSTVERLVHIGGSGLQFGTNGAGDIGILDMVNRQWVLQTVTSGDIPATVQGVAVTYLHRNLSLISPDDELIISQSGKLYRMFVDNNAPVNPRGCVSIFNIRLFHGVTMFLSWGFLLPIGATIARFGKTWPELFGAPAWFQLHRIIQSVGLLLGIAGFLAAVVPPMVGLSGFTAAPHWWIGFLVTFLGVMQPINAFFRPHPAKAGEPKPRKRLIWEIIHKYGGRLALILGMLQPFSGLQFLLAPSGYMVAYAVWFALVVTLYVVLTILGQPAGSPAAAFVHKTLFCKKGDLKGTSSAETELA